jgi:peroxiredoxin Q/BCP
MKRALMALLLAGAVAHPAFGALKPGDKGPAFDAKASLAGKTFAFSLKKALKKGPVVVYFYPAADPDYCAGKFPVASDADGKIATAYDLKVTPPKDGVKDTQGVDIDHAFTERTTFVITKDDKIFATLSSADDKISPADHVDQSLAAVEQLAKRK